jgi:hypothetical protein
MNTIKCHRCNFPNFADSTVCKRCKSPLTNAQSSAPSQQAFAPDPAKPDRFANQTDSVHPSLVNIVKNDYGALLGFILPLLLWGLFIATNVFGFSFSRRGRTLPADSSDSTFLYIAIIGTVFGIALLVWRVYTFQQVFANGEKAIGRITTVTFFKDRGRIQYSYSVNGQTYETGNSIMKNRTTQSFQDGSDIELIVDRSNPKRAFIKALYS